MSTAAVALLRSRLAVAQPEEVLVGYQTLHVFSAAELDEGQLGYSRDPSGNDLTGAAPGDWSTDWVAIGYEGMCGDPLIVDVGDAGLPVLTAMHGMGAWDPSVIAGTLDGFLEALRAVARVSVGRDSPVALKGNPLTTAEQSDLLNALECLGPDADRGWWLGLFDID